MSLPHAHIAPGYGHHYPLIDAEFDQFELNTELEETLRDLEAANFYHDLLNAEE